MLPHPSLEATRPTVVHAAGVAASAEVVAVAHVSGQVAIVLVVARQRPHFFAIIGLDVVVDKHRDADYAHQEREDRGEQEELVHRVHACVLLGFTLDFIYFLRGFLLEPDLLLVV